MAEEQRLITLEEEDIRESDLDRSGLGSEESAPQSWAGYSWSLASRVGQGVLKGRLVAI